MRITIFFGVLSTHQEGLCNAFYNILGDDFKAVVFDKLPDFRVELGFKDLSQKYSYCIVLPTDENEREKMLDEIIAQSDIGIVGGVTDEIFDKFLAQNKRCFLFSERFYKKSKWKAYFPPIRKKIQKRFRNDPNFEVLCASAYLPKDLRITGYTGRCLQWGYFPQINVKEYLERKNEKVKILWVGRLIKLKHPETILKSACKLRKKNLDFEITIIGDGPCKAAIEKEIIKNNLTECVSCKNSMPPAKIHELMCQFDIFMATSDFQEGWGVVVNESLTAGCAVIASSSMGAVPFMIKDGFNGYSCEWYDIDKFSENLEMLVLDKNLREEISKNAYMSIRDSYSPNIAAERFCRYVSGEEFDDGICSILN